MGSGNVSQAAARLEKLHETLVRDTAEQQIHLDESIEQQSGNLAELNSIINESRSSGRKKKGFFGRLFSYFRYNSSDSQKILERSAETAGINHYEDYQIARAAFERAASGLDYNAYPAADGIRAEVSSEADRNTSANAKVADINYGNILRLVGASAKFEHGVISGKDEAAYTAKKAQLRMLGEYRDLVICDSDSITLFKDFATDTESLSAVVQVAPFTYKDDVSVATSRFYVMNGNGKPNLHFDGSMLALTSKKFAVTSTGISARGSVITAEELRLVTAEKEGTKSVPLSGSLTLSDNGITVNDAHSDDGIRLFKDDTERLTYGMTLTNEREYESLEFMGVSLRGVRISEGNRGTTLFAAKSALISGAEFLSIEEVSGVLGTSDARITSMNLGVDSIGLAPIKLSDVSVSLFKDRLPEFNSLSFTKDKIKLGGFMEINGAVFSVSSAAEGVEVSSQISGAEISGETGGFYFSAKNVGGKITLCSYGIESELSSDIAALGYRNVIDFSSRKAFIGDGVFRAEGISVSAADIGDKNGFLSAEGISVSTDSISVNKDGISGEGISGEIARIKILDLSAYNAAFSVTKNGFAASGAIAFDPSGDNKLSGGTAFSVSLGASLAVSKKDGAFSAVFSDIAAQLNICGRNGISIGSVSIDDSGFRFEKLSGSFAPAENYSAAVTDGSGLFTKSERRFGISLADISANGLSMSALALDVNGKEARLSIRGIDAADSFINISSVKSSINESGVIISEAALSVNAPGLALNQTIKNAAITSSGLSIESLSAEIGAVTVGEFLSVDGAGIEVGKPDGQSYSLAMTINGLKTAAAAGGFSIRSSAAQGRLSCCRKKLSISFTGGELSASFRDAFGFKMSDLGYDSGVLSAGKIDSSKVSMRILGDTITIDDAYLAAKKLKVSKTGIDLSDNESEIKISADRIGLFGVGISEPSITLFEQGWKTELAFDPNTALGREGMFTLSASGKLSIVDESGNISVIPENFGGRFDFLNRLTLCADGMGVSGNTFTSALVSGAISLPFGSAEFSGTNAVIDKDGPTAESFSAQLSETTLFNVLKVSGAMTASENFGTIDVLAAVSLNTAFISTDGTAAVSFNKTDAGYKARLSNAEINRQESPLMKLDSLKIQDSEDDGGKLKADVKSIYIKPIKAMITDSSAELSEGGIEIPSAKLSFDKLGAFLLPTVTVNGFCADKQSVSFDSITINLTDGNTLDLGGILTAQSAKVLLSKPRNKPLSVTTDVSDMELTAPTIGAFSAAAENISGSVTWSDKKTTAELKSGSLKAAFGDFIEITLSGLSYKDGIFGVQQAAGSMEELSLAGGSIGLSGLSVSADNLTVSRNRIGSSSGLRGKLDNARFFSAALNNTEFVIKDKSFKASSNVSAQVDFASAFSLSAAGSFTLSAAGGKTGLDADFSELSADISILNSSSLHLENISGDPAGLMIGKAAGFLSFANNKFSASVNAQNLLLGNEGVEGSINAHAEPFSLFGGMLSFSESDLRLTENLTHVNFMTSVAAATKSFSVKADAEVDAKKGDKFPNITLNNINANICGAAARDLSLGITAGGTSFSASEIAFSKQVSLSGISGFVSSKLLKITSANIDIALSDSKKISTEINNFELGEKGLSVEKIKATMPKIALGDYLSVDASSLSLSYIDNKPSVELEINNLSANAALGDFYIKTASGINGIASYNDSSVTAEMTSGALSVGYGSLVEFSISGLSFDSRRGLSAASVRSSENGITKEFIGGSIVLNKAKFSADSLVLDKKGLSAANKGKAVISAESLKVLKQEIESPELAVDRKGISSSFTLKPSAIPDDADIAISAAGTVRINKPRSSPISITTENLSAKLKMFKAVNLAAENIKADVSSFSCETVTGFIQAGRTAIALNAGKISIDKDGAKAETFAARVENAPLAGDSLIIKSADIEAQQNFAEITAKGTVSVGFGESFHAEVSPVLKFKKDNRYRPEFQKLDIAELTIANASLTGLHITKNNGEDNDSTDISIERIAVPSLNNAVLTNVSGSFSDSGVTVNEGARFSMDEFLGISMNNVAVPAFSVREGGLYFDRTFFGEYGLNLGDVLSAKAKFYASSEKEKGVTLEAADISLNLSAKAGELSADGIKGSVKYENGSVSVVITSGTLSASLFDVLNIKLGGISYQDNKFVSSDAEVTTPSISLAGGAVSAEGFKLAAKQLTVSAAGIEPGKGIYGSIDSFRLLSAKLSNINFSYDKQNGFSAKAHFGADTSFAAAGVFSAYAAGDVKVTKSEGDFAVDFTDFSGGMSLDAGIGSASAAFSGVNKAENGISVDSIEGSVSFGKKVTARIATKGTSTFRSGGASEIADVEGAIEDVSFFSNALCFSGTEFSAVNNLTDFTAKGTVGIDLNGRMSGEGDFEINVGSANGYRPTIKRVSFRNTKIGESFSVEALTLESGADAAKFTAKRISGGAIVISDIAGQYGDKALCIDSAALSVGNITSELTAARITPEGISFGKLSVKAGEIDLGSAIKVVGASLTITGENDVYTASVELQRISADAALGDLRISAGMVNGFMQISSDPSVKPTAALTGEINADYRDLLSFRIKDISYKDEELWINEVSASAGADLNVLGEVVCVKGARFSASGIAFGKEGLKFTSGGKASVRVDSLGIFGNTVLTDQTLDINSEGFSGRMTIGSAADKSTDASKPKSLSIGDNISFSVSGSVIITHANKSTTVTAQNLSASFNMYNAAVLNAENMTAENEQFTADSVSGALTFAPGKAIEVSVSKLNIGKGGPSFDTLTAKVGGGKLFDVLSLDDTTLVTNGDFSSITVTGGMNIATDFLSLTAADSRISLKKNAGRYAVSLDKLTIGEFSVGGFAMKNLAFSDNEESLCVNVEFITAPSIGGAVLSGFSGSFSRDKFTFGGGSFTMDAFGGFPKIEKKNLPMFTIDKDGLTFTKFSLLSGAVSVGDILTAKDSDISLGRTAETGLEVSAEIADAQFRELNGRLFSLSASGITGGAALKNNLFSAHIDSGRISARLGSILDITMTGLSYAQGKLSVSEAAAASKEINLYNILTLDDLSVTATNFGFDRNGFVTDSSSSLKAQGKLGLLSKPVGEMSLSINNSGYEGTLTLEKKNRIGWSDIFSIALGGTIRTFCLNGTAAAAFENLSGDIDILGAIKAGADNITENNGALSASDFFGSIYFGSQKIVDIKADELSISDSLSYKNMTGRFGDVSLFGGMIRIKESDSEIRSADISAINTKINAVISAGGVSAGALVKLDFTKEGRYRPKLAGIDDFNLNVANGMMIISGFSVSSGAEDSVSYIGKSLSIGSTRAFTASDISGTLTPGSFALDSAKGHLNAFGMSIDNTVTGLTADSGGLFFDNIGFGAENLDYGVFSAQSAALSLSNTREKGFSAKADAKNAAIQANYGIFSAFANNLALHAEHDSAGDRFGFTGRIDLRLADTFGISLSDIVYESGELKGTVGMAEKSISLLNGLIRLDGLSADVQNFALSKSGMTADSFKVRTAGMYILGKKAPEQFSFTVDKTGITISQTFGKEQNILDFGTFKAGIGGEFSAAISKDGVKSDFRNVSAVVTLFDRFTVKGEGLEVRDGAFNAQRLEGDFAFNEAGGAVLHTEAADVVLSARGIDFKSFTGGVNGTFGLFGGILNIGNPTITVNKPAPGKYGFELGGDIGFSSEFFCTSVSGKLAYGEETGRKLRIKELKNLSLSVPKLGAGISVASITQDDKALIMSDASISAAIGDENTLLGGLMSRVEGSIGAKIAEIKYVLANGKDKSGFVFDPKTVQFLAGSYTVKVTDDLSLMFSPKDKKAGVNYNLALPSSMKESGSGSGGDKKTLDVPRLLDLGIDFPIVPGVSVGGSLFAGAGVLIENSAEINLDTEDKSFTLNLSGNIRKAIAGLGLEAYIKFGFPGVGMELGLRGTLALAAPPESSGLSVSLSMNYGKDKFLSVNDQNTRFNVDLTAKLQASLDAFGKARFFAFFNKDMFTFNIKNVTLTGVEFHVFGERENGGWVFASKDKLVKSDIARDVILNSRMLEYEKRSVKTFSEVKEIVSDANNAVLGFGEMGRQEAAIKQADLFNNVIPKFEEIRKQHDKALRLLQSADRNYESAASERVGALRDYYLIEQNALAAEQLDSDSAESERMQELTSKAGLITSDYRKRRASLDQMPTEQNIGTSVYFLPPVKILTFLSRFYRFTGQNMAKRFQNLSYKYTITMEEIQWLYNHPVSAEGVRPNSISALAGRQDLAVNYGERELRIKMEESSKSLSALKKESVLLGKANARVLDIEKKMAAAPGKPDSRRDKLYSQLCDERSRQQAKVNDCRKMVNVESRRRVNEMLRARTRDFTLSREEIDSSRVARYRGFALRGKLSEQFDIKQILNPPADKTTLQYYLSYYDKSKRGNFQAFRAEMVKKLVKNAETTRSAILDIIGKNGAMWDGGPRAKMSNQMRQILYSGDIYMRAGMSRTLFPDSAGKSAEELYGDDGEDFRSRRLAMSRFSKPNDEHDISDESLHGALEYMSGKTIKEIEAEQAKVKRIVDLVNEADNCYIEANEMFIRLAEVDTSDFQNTVDRNNGLDGYKRSPRMDSALNTLEEADKLRKNKLSDESIDSLTKNTLSMISGE